MQHGAQYMQQTKYLLYIACQTEILAWIALFSSRDDLMFV